MGDVERLFDCVICVGKENCRDVEEASMTLLMMWSRGWPVENVHRGLCPRHKNELSRALALTSPP